MFYIFLPNMIHGHRFYRVCHRSLLLSKNIWVCEFMRFNISQVCHFCHLLHTGCRRNSNQQQVQFAKLHSYHPPMKKNKGQLFIPRINSQEFAFAWSVGQSWQYCDLPSTGIQPFKIILNSCFVKLLFF